MAPHLRKTFIELAVNIAGPWLVYTLALPHTDEFHALVASAVPPIVWSLYELVTLRKIDALSLFVLGSIGLSVAAIGLGGSPRMLLVRENIFSVPLGLAFLLTAPLRRPLLYHIASAIFTRQSEEHAARFAARGQKPGALRAMRIMSIVWGAGVIAQGLFLAWAAWTWRVSLYLVAGPVIGYGSIIVLALWTVAYQQRLSRRAAGA